MLQTQPEGNDATKCRKKRKTGWSRQTNARQNDRPPNFDTFLHISCKMQKFTKNAEKRKSQLKIMQAKIKIQNNNKSQP